MAIDYTLTPYPVVDLLSWHAGKALDLSPKFQRNPVWKIAARSQFVDTLLRGLPVPPTVSNASGPSLTSLTAVSKSVQISIPLGPAGPSKA
jgi:hypothetical protein